MKRETIEKYPFLTRYTDSQKIYLRTRINGRLVEKSTGTDSLSKALTIAKRLMIEAGGSASKVGRINYEDLKDEVLLHKQVQSPNTLASAKYQFAHLDKFFIGMPAEDFNETLWHKYEAFCRRETPDRQLEHDR